MLYPWTLAEWPPLLQVLLLLHALTPHSAKDKHSKSTTVHSRLKKTCSPKCHQWKRGVKLCSSLQQTVYNTGVRFRAKQTPCKLNFKPHLHYNFQYLQLQASEILQHLKLKPPHHTTGTSASWCISKCSFKVCTKEPRRMSAMIHEQITSSSFNQKPCLPYWIQNL